jgi:hypothetical protein
MMSLAVVAYRSPLDTKRAAVKLSQATGFLVRFEKRLFLITNWHVLTGRNPITGEVSGSAALPEYLEVSFPVLLGGDLYWTAQRLDLYDRRTREALWFVHPYAPPMEGGTDVIALPIDSEPPMVYAYSLEDALDVRALTPGAEVSIVGYPFGVETEAPVWSRATVASEPRHGFKDDPMYLVDTRSRPGQSGSPVISPDSRLVRCGSGQEPDQKWSLAGIYSGRVDAELDLGRLWWPVVISEVLSSMHRDRLRFE